VKRPVIFTREAGDQISALYQELAAGTSGARALRIVENITARCERFGEFPFLGRSRPDLGADIRTFAFDRRTVVAYAVQPDTVVIIGVFRRGEDFETALRRPES
jgi:toxin ParE1/3/4